MQLLWLPASLLFGADALNVHQKADPVVVYDDPQVKYTPLPSLPNMTESANQAEAAGLQQTWSLTEAHAAEGQSQAATEMEQANLEQLKAAQQELQTTEAAQLAVAAAEHSRRMKAQAQAIAKHTKELVEQIPMVAHDAAERAIQDVMHETLQKLKLQACEAAKSAKATEEAMMKKAADAAQKAASPYQQAKLQASQHVVSYLSKAQALGGAAVQLKGKAMEIAWQAAKFQGNLNTLPMAQQVSMQARDMMDKAKQLEGQAAGFQSTASSISGSLGLYDLQASAASSYASYQANPGGGSFKMPPLPRPLELPKDCFK